MAYGKHHDTCYIADRERHLDAAAAKRECDHFGLSDGRIEREREGAVDEGKAGIDGEDVLGETGRRDVHVGNQEIE